VSDVVPPRERLADRRDPPRTCQISVKPLPNWEAPDLRCSALCDADCWTSEGAGMDHEAVEREAPQPKIELKIPGDVLKVRHPIGAYMRWDRPDSLGVTTFQTIGLAPPAPPSPNVCTRTRLLDLMGYGRTGADGSIILHVRDFVCWDDWKIGSEDQVWVVATARSKTPAVLTHIVQVPPVLHGPPPPPTEVDLQIRIFSWDGAGQAKPGVFFAWRAVLTVSIPTGEEE